MNDKEHLNNIQSRYIRTLENIKQVCSQCDRSPESVKLVVVTKGHSAEDTHAVIAAGARYLGENYVEETTQKKAALDQVAGQVAWYMIGHIQSRKANLIPAVYDQVHSIDRLKIAEKLNQQLERSGTKLPILLQYNVGGEAQKHGWQANDEKSWSLLLPEFLKILALPHLCVTGLMTMPPFTTDQNEAFNNFMKLQKLRVFFQANISGLELKELSMGTSHDYEAAIRAGATFIRIGTAIMGERAYK